MSKILACRKNLVSSFEKLDCVLLPHPGLKVAKGASRGAKKDLEIDFIEELNVRIYSHSKAF
jgi:hypothetical protein